MQNKRVANNNKNSNSLGDLDTQIPTGVGHAFSDSRKFAGTCLPPSGHTRYFPQLGPSTPNPDWNWGQMLIPPFEEVELRNYTEDGELRVEKKLVRKRNTRMKWDREKGVMKRGKKIEDGGKKRVVQSSLSFIHWHCCQKALFFHPLLF